MEGLDELVDRPGWGSEEGLMHLENGSRPTVTPHVKTLRVMTCCFFCKVYSRLKAFSHFSSFLSSWEWIKFRSGARQHIMFKTWPHRANDLHFPLLFQEKFFFTIKRCHFWFAPHIFSAKSPRWGKCYARRTGNSASPSHLHSTLIPAEKTSRLASTFIRPGKTLHFYPS